MMRPWSFYSCSSKLSSRVNIIHGSSLSTPVSVTQSPHPSLMFHWRGDPGYQIADGVERKGRRREHTRRAGESSKHVLSSPHSGHWKLCSDAVPLPQLHPIVPFCTLQWHWSSLIMEMWAHACLLFHVQVFCQVAMLWCSCQRQHIDRRKRAKLEQTAHILRAF